MFTDGEKIKEQLNTEYFGRNMIHLPSVDSTNSYLKKLRDAINGTIVIADSQTGGRGRRGRNFWSPSGGIYMSILCNVSGCFDAGKITSCAALSVCKAIEKCTELTPKIKWVNDIFLSNRKVCGILCEAITNSQTAMVESVVIGIGINVSDIKVPQELESIVTNLNRESGKELDRNHLISEILNNLEKDLRMVDSNDFTEELRRRSFVLGKRIIVHFTDNDYEAVAIDLDSACRLIVKRGEKVIALSSGEVSVSSI